MNMTRSMQVTEHQPGIGDVIGGYRLVGVIGEGYSGPLYVAEQSVADWLEIRNASKIVALRCIRPELARSQRFRERFFEAASMAVRCEHPNVVNVLEMDEVRGRYFVSMEYLPGESLAAILAKCGPHTEVAPDMAAYLVKRVASALQYVQELREASPRPVREPGVEVDASNVVVTHCGAVKWLGVALPSAANETTPRTARRSVNPARPRQALVAADGDAERGDAAFDLGVLLWTCLVPEQPVPDQRAGVEQAAPRRDAKALTSARADVPEGLAAIVVQAVTADPRERFESVQALSDALDGYLLRRDSRPTPEHVRRWMERVFGAERGSLQIQVSRGRDVTGALALLDSSGHAAGAVGRSAPKPRPRELWVTNHLASSGLGRASLAPHPPPEAQPRAAPDERTQVSPVLTQHMLSAIESAAALVTTEVSNGQGQPSRRWLLGMMIAAALAVGAVLVVSTPGGPAFENAAARLQWTDARADVRSTPPGAAVFVDGVPTGLRTPVVLKGFPTDRPIQLRVEKAGFAPQVREIEIAAGSVQTVVCELAASDGLAVFAGAPPNARIYVDDEEIMVKGKQPVMLPVGPHVVRVETSGELTFSGRVVIVAGEQTVRVAPGRASL